MQTDVGDTVFSDLSPHQLTSLLVQHDQSPDAGIFTLTGGKEGRNREKGGEKGREEERFGNRIKCDGSEKVNRVELSGQQR